MKPFSSAIARFVALSFARPLVVICAFAVLAAGAGLLASRLAFKGSFVELLPASAPEVKDLKFVSEKAGGDGYLVVQLTGADPEVLKAFAGKAAPALGKHPEVRYVEYRYDVDFFKTRGLLLLPAEKIRALREDLSARLLYEKQQANPLAVDLSDAPPPPTLEALEKKYASEAPRSEYLSSRDGKELYLFIKPSGFAGDLEYCRRLIARVDSTLGQLAKAYPTVRSAYAGAYQIRLEEDVVMRRDLSRASVLSAAIAMVLILLATRKGSALLVVGAPVMVGIAVTFAVAQLAIGHLNVVTGFLVAILIGLGIEYGVHLSMRYWEARRSADAEAAMVTAFSGTFAGALASALTNAAAFFILVFAKFRAFAQFGFIAGVGVLLAVVTAYALGPAVLALAERIRPLSLLRRERAKSAGGRSGVRWPTGVIAAVGVVVVSFAAFSACVAPTVGYESDLRKLKGASPATALDDHISEELGVKITPAIFWVKDLTSARQVVRSIRESMAQHGQASAFQKVLSLQDLLPEDVGNRQREIEALRPLLEKVPGSAKRGEAGEKLASFKRMLNAQPFGPEAIPLELRRKFQALDGEGTFVLLFPKKSLYDTAEIQSWAGQIDEVVRSAAQAGVETRVLDGNRIAARIFELVQADGPYILWSAAAVVFVMILITLRRLSHALLVAGPLFVGMLCLAGAMHLFGVRLNFINAVVLPNLLAIGVDNSIHLFHRYKQEGRGSLGHVVRHTGLAAIVATLSNAAGYGALLIANHQGLRSIGFLAVLGVVCTFLGTTVLFPAALALKERWGDARSRKQALAGLSLPTCSVKPTERPA